MADPQKKRDNSGALWKNKRKQKENHPDFAGEALIGGREYWVSGWARESAQGNRYTSLAFKPKAPRPEYVAPKSSAQPGGQQRIPGSDDDQGDYPT